MKERSMCLKKCMVAHDLEWKCSENGKNGTKHKKKGKKRSFWRSTIFDHPHLVVW